MIERLIDGSSSVWPAVATHLWQSTLVLLALALAARALRGAPARLICAFWWIALLKLFLPLPWVGRVGEGLATALANLLLAEPARAGDWGAVRVLFYPEVLQVSASGAGLAGPTIYFLLTVGWILGVASLLFRRLRGRHRNTLPPAPRGTAERQARVETRLAEALGGTSIPRAAVAVCERATMPHVAGWWRPRIHVSPAAVDGLAPSDLRAVLLHEDAHRRRRDPLRSAALGLAGTLLFFYPPIWWLIRRIRETTEMACDEAALAAGLTADEYAGSLARTLRLGLAQAGATAIHGRRSSLNRRFARLNRNRRFVTMNRHRITFAAAVLLVVVASVAPIIPAAAERDDAVLQTVPPIELDGIEGLDRKVDLNFKASRVETVLETLGRRAGFEVSVDESLRTERINLQLNDVTVGKGLAVVAKKVGLAYSVPRPGMLHATRSGPLLAGVGDVTNPRLITESKVDPVYPESMREAGIEGKVILQAVIDASGNVGQLSVLNAQPRDHAELIASALDAVREWHYHPATRDGEPVAVYFTIFIEYKLHDKDAAAADSKDRLR